MIPTIDTTKAGIYALRIAVTGLVLSFVIVILPSIPLPADITSAIRWLVQTFLAFDFLFPINTMVWIGQLIIVTEVSMLGVRVWLWLDEKFNKFHT